MNSLVIFFFLLGVIFIITGQQKYNCPLPQVEFKYIPKSFTAEQYERIPIMSTYGRLFTDVSPWEKSAGYPNLFSAKKEYSLI